MAKQKMPFDFVLKFVWMFRFTICSTEVSWYRELSQILIPISFSAFLHHGSFCKLGDCLVIWERLLLWCWVEFSWTEEMQKSSLSCKWVPPSVVIPASQFLLLKLLFECVLLVGRINWTTFPCWHNGWLRESKQHSLALVGDELLCPWILEAVAGEYWFELWWSRWDFLQGVSVQKTFTTSAQRAPLLLSAKAVG